MAADEDDEFRFWRYEDLHERRIVSDRADLHRKQANLNFPKPMKFRPGRGAAALFRVAAVKRWVKEHAL